MPAPANLGVPSVWIDHHAYLKQRHKQCAFNLYIAAAMEKALAPICRDLQLTAHTLRGPLTLRVHGKPGARQLVLQLPPGPGGELVLPLAETVNLPELPGAETPTGHRRYRLPPTGELTLTLKHT